MSNRFEHFRKHRAHALLGVPIRVLVGVVFIYASLYKLAEPRDFAISIAMYEMLPLGLINLMAITLPAIELVAGITLIVGLWTRESALVISGMLVVFIIAISYVVFVRGEPNFGCGCFSPAAEAAEEEMASGTLIRDVMYLLGCGYVFFFDSGALGIDGWLRWRRRASDGG